MQFLIIHGSFGSADGNWFPELKEKLENLDQKVILPQFPVDNWDELTQKGEGALAKSQTLHNWLNTLDSYIEQIKATPTVVIAHSIGPLFILHATEKYRLHFDCAVFVAPFLSKLNKSWQIDAANSTFYRTDFNPTLISSSFNTIYTVYGTNDPYVDFEYTNEFIALTKSQTISVKNGCHLNNESGFTSFPLILELAKSRIEPKDYLSSH